MSETTSTDSADSTDEDGTTDEGGTDTATLAPGVTEPAKPAAKAGDVPPEVRRALGKANKEAETLRRRLKEFEDRDKTDLQKAQERADAAEQRATELEGKRKTDNTRTAIIAAAATAGAVDPEAVYRLMDVDTLAVGDDGTPTNPASAVAKVLRDKPYLAGRTATREARDNGQPATATDMSSLIRRSAGLG